MWCVRCACELNYDEDDLCLNCEADEFYGAGELEHCETCNDTGYHPADGMSHACPDCEQPTDIQKADGALDNVGVRECVPTQTDTSQAGAAKNSDA